MKKLLKVLFVAFLIASFIAPGFTVYATEADVSDSDIPKEVAEADAAQESNELGNGKKGALFLAYHRLDDIIEPEITSESTGTFPEKYDLRELGVVTPVKSQNPFGTCWGFATIAASETSILSSMGKTYEETGLDLSEHHLTYFARTHIDDETSSQNGEGLYVDEDVNSLNTGGIFITSVSVLSSGIGPVNEELVPYRGKNSNAEGVAFVNVYYSEDDDWTIPSDYEFIQQYQLVESNILTSPAVYDYGDDMVLGINPEENQKYYLGYNQKGTDEIKSELMKGKAVSIAFAADISMPGQTHKEQSVIYMAEDEYGRWLHYTHDCASASHAVTIVGWDDSIPAESFNDHSEDEGGDGLPHFPEGDGAWIVKNSWGAETEAFPNMIPWGNMNAEGKRDGYFYMSYYDTSICCPESFEFLPDANETSYIIDEYDYMQNSEFLEWLADTGLQMANRFVAEEDEIVTDVSCMTTEENMKVTYQIYLLDDGAKSPDDGTLVTTQTKTYEHAGYHRLKLDNPVEVSKGGAYAIVVTETLEYNDKLYYALNTREGLNKTGRVQYDAFIKNEIETNYPEENADDYLSRYYAVGIVNPGESYVYIDEIGQWFDFADMIDTLRLNSEALFEYDYDNFSIKSYAQFKDPARAEQIANETEIEELNYAEPATEINVKVLKSYLIGALLALVVLIILIIVLVKAIKKKIARKRMEKLAGDDNTQVSKKVDEQKSTAEGNNE